MEFLLSLATMISEDEDFDEAYENHVKDSMSLLESHSCSIALIAPKNVDGTLKLPTTTASIPGAPRDVHAHTLSPSDPILGTLLDVLETFFTNPIETNLCLTETIIDLAACGLMHIEGWLLPLSSSYTYPTSDSDDEEDSLTITSPINPSLEALERAQVRAHHLALRAPNLPSPSSLPRLLTTLQSLVNTTVHYRTTIPKFSALLLQRRHAFQTFAGHSAIAPLPHRPPPRTSLDSETSRSVSPPPNRSAFDSLAQRIFPEFATPSRESSPRGRSSQEVQGGIGGGVGTPRLGLGPVLGLGLGAGRETSSRGSSRAFSPSPLRAALVGEEGKEEAFGEVDRRILARRVGMGEGWKLGGGVGAVPFPDLKGEKPGAKEESKDVKSDDEEEETEGEEEDGEEAQSEHSEEGDEAEAEAEEEKTVSVSHVLTNVIVLQEFLLELAALVQVRAGLFGEVRFA